MRYIGGIVENYSSYDPDFALGPNFTHIIVSTSSCVFPNDVLHLFALMMFAWFFGQENLYDELNGIIAKLY